VGTPPAVEVRLAGPDDAGDAARLLHDFNTEFGEATPGAEKLAERLRELWTQGDTVVLLAGTPAVGVAVMRLRLSIWTAGRECYLAELYVEPGRRGQGVGRALMTRVLEIAREQGADWIELNSDEDDTAARALYESLGFEKTAYYYELEL
jgi:ribosomal protein S18 acetylase RimI-like enzyme